MKGIRSTTSILAAAVISGLLAFSSVTLSAESKNSAGNQASQKAAHMDGAQLGSAINLNKADLQTLAQLNGVGESKAEAIIAYRQANGGFKSVDDLLNVKGIGQKIVDKNRSRLSVN